MKEGLKRALLVIVLSGISILGILLSGNMRSAAIPEHPYKSSVGDSAEEGFVLRADEGEILQRGKGNTVTIKVDPKTGSPNMALGTQLLESGAGIPVHKHEHEDEVLFIHEGNGTAVLGEQRKSVSKGDTVFVPKGVWHGVETHKDGINLLWVVTPPGLEGFFREISSPVGKPPKTLTPSQIKDIGRKHGVNFKQR